MNRAYSRAGIIARLFNAPLAVTPQTAAVVLGAIGERFDVSQLFVPTERRALPLHELQDRAAAELASLDARGEVDRRAKGARADQLMFVHNGVAHVAIRGETVAENGIGPSSGFTGYDGIVAQVQSADADPNVRGILLDVDSPGGEVAGLYECAAILMARRGVKPMRAMIRGMGCSAAYTIAACADEVTLHDLGYAGSNGIISMHADFSQSLEQDGIKVTMFTAGAHKADGNPFEALPEDVAKSIQTRVDIAYSRLVAHVAAARGISEDDVRRQEARVYQGEEAIQAGLVDKVMGWQDSMDEFEQLVNEPAPSARGGKAPVGARSAKGPSMDESEIQAAIAAARTEGHAEGATAGATAERERISALAEIDGESTLSASLTEAIAAGTSAGDFAVAQAQKAKATRSAALEAAKEDAVGAGDLPEGSAAAADPGKPKANRGAAAVERLRGKVPGLPAKA